MQVGHKRHEDWRALWSSSASQTFRRKGNESGRSGGGEGEGAEYERIPPHPFQGSCEGLWIALETMTREKWAAARDTTGGGGQKLSSVLKVPRHCPFVLLVGVSI
jgi:hypothetical protein